MSDPAQTSVREGGHPSPVSVINADGSGTVVLVCEHASRFIPQVYGTLGLGAEALHSHIAWDIGALELARTLSSALDAPLVAAEISRVVYDCNRPPEAADAVPARSERFEIPGNRVLSPAALQERVRNIHDPFHQALAAVLSERPGPTVLVTVHSFTPIYLGQEREVELGLLHDDDPALAEAMFRIAPDVTALRTQLNQPYDASDGVTYTLRRHAVPAGTPNVMIEVRNDQIDSDAGIARVARDFTDLLGRALDATAGRTAPRA